MTKKNKILFINPTGWQKESINLGLSYLSAALKKAGYSTLTLDINYHPMSDLALVQRVKEYSPSIVGISVKTATANEGGRIANLLRAELGEAVFLVGGPHITICAESYMKAFPVFHYGIMGEGEQSIVELVDAIEDKRPADLIAGVVHRSNGQIIVNPWSPPAHLDTLPMPDIDAIEGFDWNDFRYPIVTSRGCPFDCIYCCVNKLTGSRKWRSRSVTNVVDELENVVRTRGIKTFEVWDDNFTLDIKRAKEICRELINRKLNLSWYCHNGIRADRIDKELAKLMKQAGCTSIAFGIESGNPATFNSIKKGEPLSAVVNAVNIVKTAGIKAVGYFIIGLPGDTLDKFIETVRFQRSLKLDNYVFGMLIPYPKTEVWDIVQTRGTMFCDITRTQHFHSDIVPISFEMHEFPRQDMVRAFYIAKYFPLYEAVQKVIDSSRVPVVVYQANTRLNASLAGMMIACHPGTRHIVVGELDKDSITELPSFSQLPDGINITFEQTMPNDLSKDALIVVCHQDQLLSKHIVFSNTGLIIVDPSLPRTIQVRKYIKPLFALPGSMLSVIGVFSALADSAAEFSASEMRKVLKIQLKIHYPGLVKLIKMIIKIPHRIYGLPKRAISLPWQMYHYSRARKRLKMIKPGKKKAYPYDDYPTYL